MDRGSEQLAAGSADGEERQEEHEAVENVRELVASGGRSMEEVARPQAGNRKEAAAIAIFDEDQIDDGEVLVDTPAGHGEQLQAS